MKKILAVLLALVLVLGLAACGKGNDDGNTDPENPDEPSTGLSICLIVGYLGDNSFADAANLGVQQAKNELGASVKIIEYGNDPTKRPPALLDAADEGFDMIVVGNDVESNAAIEENAANYPDTFFFIYDVADSFTTAHTNVQGCCYGANESDYLVAVVAAQMTQTGVIGFMGGDENVGINDFLVGYLEGCGYGDPESKVAWTFIAEGTDSWSNPTKGKELSMVLYNQGADFIHGVAGQSGDGVFEAVLDIRANGDDSVWAIGVDQDQREVFLGMDRQDIADIIITSALKVVGAPIFQVAEQLTNGEAPASGVVISGLKEGSAGISQNDFYKENVPQETQDFVNETIDKIISGEIKVSSAYGMSAETLDGIKDQFAI